MLKKAIAAAALLAVTGAPLSAYAAGATLGRTAAPATASSKEMGNGALYVVIGLAVLGTALIIIDDDDGSDSP